MNIPVKTLSVAVISAALALTLTAGPYSAALNDPVNPYDSPVPGFVGPDGTGMARLWAGSDENGDPIYENPDNYVNPVFFAWADSITSYQPSESIALAYSDSSLALGPVTGDNFDVVSLGDMTSTAISGGSPPGTITLAFAKPIRNLSGADFVVFENGHLTTTNQGGAGVGGIFGELAYVWVSDGGVNFVKIPATSLTPSAVGPYGSLDPTNINNLAGKHLNAYGNSWGTPFDLSSVGLQQITHIRLVDIPGNGAFKDQAGRPIYDAWKTFGSGGFDLEAIGAISTEMTFADWPQLANLNAQDRGPDADPDGDGIPNLLEYAFDTLPWKPDANPPGITQVGGHAVLSFVRDERLADLVYEVQTSSTMAPNDWTTIASSTGGAPLQGVNGNSPVISESSADNIRSIGVVRKVTLRDTAPTASSPHRFLRVKVTTTSNSTP